MVVVGLAWASIVAATRLIQCRTEVYEQYRRLLAPWPGIFVAGTSFAPLPSLPRFASVGVLASS